MEATTLRDQVEMCKTRAGIVINWPVLNNDYNFAEFLGWGFQEAICVFSYKESFLQEFILENPTVLLHGLAPLTISSGLGLSFLNFAVSSFFLLFQS